MRENEKIFLELVHKGIYKIYKNGKIYALMISHKEWKGEYKKRNIPKLKNYKTDKGYIRFTFKDKKQIFAHRVVWMYFNGDIPRIFVQGFQYYLCIFQTLSPDLFSQDKQNIQYFLLVL